MTLGFNRFSPRRIVSLHYQALRDEGANSLSWGSRFWLFGAPALVAAVAGVGVAVGMDVRDGVSQLLAATALLVGAMLSAFVFLANLRIKMSENHDFAFRLRFHKLVAGAAVGCLYVAGVALMLALLLALVASVGALRLQAVQPFSVAVLVGVLAHLGVNLLSAIRRLLDIYTDFFPSDFEPDLNAPLESPESVSGHSRRAPGRRVNIFDAKG